MKERKMKNVNRKEENNKITFRRKSKEESMEEMVVVLDSGFVEGEGGEEVASFLQGRGVEVRMEEGEVAGSVVWMRKKGTVMEEEYPSIFFSFFLFFFIVEKFLYFRR